MARAPIKEQSRFAPALARARINDTFAPARFNPETGRLAATLGENLGLMAQMRAEEDARRAEEERETGRRDFAAGLIRDGQRVIDGELQPIQSEYYTAGVERARGERFALDVSRHFAEWEAENPRPLDPDAYSAWLESGLSQSQLSAGIDPEGLTEIESEFYAERLGMIRERDVQRQLSFANEQIPREIAQTVEAGFVDLASSFDGEDVASFHEGLGRGLTMARATGLDLNATRRAAYQAALNAAERTGNLSVLESLPDAPFMTPALQGRRRDDLERLQADLAERQMVDQGAFKIENDDLIRSGNFGEAEAVVRSAVEAGTIDTDFAATQLRHIHAQQETARRDTQIRRRSIWRDQQRTRAGDEALNALIRGEAFTISDVSLTDPAGDTFTVSESELRDDIRSRFRAAMLGPEPFALTGEDLPRYRVYTSHLALNGMVDSQLRSYLSSSAAHVTPEGILADGATERLSRAYEVYRQLEPEVAGMYVTNARVEDVFAEIDRIAEGSPDMSLEAAAREAVGLVAMREQGDYAFAPASTAPDLDLSIEIPDREGGLFNLFSAREIEPETGEAVAFAYSEYDRLLARGVDPEAAQRRAEQALRNTYTVLNGRPLRIPQTQSGGWVTTPAQWNRNFQKYLEARNDELGTEDPADTEAFRVSHVRGNVYMVDHDQTGPEFVTAAQIQRVAGLRLQHEQERIAAERLTEAEEAIIRSRRPRLLNVLGIPAQGQNSEDE